jgi:hypothetical protein
MATNIKGDSSFSQVGTGALIITNPNAPNSLIEVPGDRTASALGMTWS